MAGGRGTPFADLPPGSIHIATAGNGGRGGFPGLFQVSHKSQKVKKSSKNFNFEFLFKTYSILFEFSLSVHLGFAFLGINKMIKKRGSEDFLAQP